ncbi:MAG: alpha/beta hydrolase [Syntrophales bacterium]|nr:alpha/beta hydrolase [Syntrophales bacterium]
MAKLRVNGIELYYEMHGEGEPLLLIMGLRRNVEWWYCQIPELAKHFRVIAFDNRGAGRSDKPEMDYSIRLFAEDSATLMESLGIERAHVLGVSMGGYIAQELAINYPDKVRALVLGCTSCGGARAVLMSAGRMEKFTANEGLTNEQILRKDMDIYFSERFIKEHPEKIDEFVEVSLRYYQPADAFERQFAACLKHDTVDRLCRMDLPVLIMTGDDDPLVPSVNSHILKELIRGSGLYLYPGRRHCFFIEEAALFNRKAIEFFNSAE